MHSASSIVLTSSKYIIDISGNKFSIIQLNAFKQLLNIKALTYTERLVYWSLKSKTSINENAVREAKELNQALLIKFKVENRSVISNLLGISVKNYYVIGFLVEPWKYIGVQVCINNKK